MHVQYVIQFLSPCILQRYQKMVDSGISTLVYLSVEVCYNVN